MTLIKIATNDLGYSENNYIWKGPEISDITVPFQGYETGTPGMELLSGDKILISDFMSGRICLTDNFGKIDNYDFFKKDIDVYSFIKDGKNTILLIANGWLMINPDGTILHEVTSNDNIGGFIILNSKKEFIAINGGNTGGIAMRKYDYNGYVLIK